jgi:hypothetical protein
MPIFSFKEKKHVCLCYSHLNTSSTFFLLIFFYHASLFFLSFTAPHPPPRAFMFKLIHPADLEDILLGRLGMKWDIWLPITEKCIYTAPVLEVVILPIRVDFACLGRERENQGE